ncbi:swr complex subunit [Podospora conica]|nr:swr complex subunit [Schizothecium conicum]
MPPPNPAIDDEEDYASEEDSDFALDDAPANDSSPSDDDDDDDEANTSKPAATGRKRPAPEAEAEDAGFENSGDEAIIEKGKNRRKKGKTADVAPDVDEGPLIKTRSMRAVEKSERRAATSNGPVTIDVDALWAQMINGTSTAQDEPQNAPPPASQESASEQQPPPKITTDPTDEQSDLVRIKRTYNFAGKVHTEEKLVARDSAEAKLYLASLGEAGETADDSTEPKRMPRKAFRSAFEPILDPTATGRRTDLNLGVSVRLRARELAAGAKKLNTVEKSRMDWAGFVDREGIKDELELAGKSKDSFVTRQDFLARSEALREADARKARLGVKT